MSLPCCMKQETRGSGPVNRAEFLRNLGQGVRSFLIGIPGTQCKIRNAGLPVFHPERFRCYDGR